MSLSMGLAPYFRRFELPWAPGEESERRFKRLLRILLIIATLLAILIWLLPMPQRAKPTVDDLRSPSRSFASRCAPSRTRSRICAKTSISRIRR
jgi:hypothetical protein